ncbi:MAG: cytochrome P450 family protein [Gemmatimonadaceae bacterium]
MPSTGCSATSRIALTREQGGWLLTDGARGTALFTRDFLANPYPVYRRLRSETPVVRVRLPTGEWAWLVTRYLDVVHVLTNDAFGKDPATRAGRRDSKPWWMPSILGPLQRNMLDVDPPDHTRLRALVHRAFTPHRVQQMRNRIEEVAEQALDRVSRTGRMDLIADYALPIPTTVIAEMIGVPVANRHRFHRWSAAIVGSDASRLSQVRAVPAIIAIIRYLRALIADRRRDRSDDLLSALIEAEEKEERLDGDEIVAMVFLLLVAGHETTVNLIGNGTFALLERDALPQLRDDAEGLTGAVEELLRYDSPLQLATERYAREDCLVGQTVVPRGARVHAVLGSANRDEEQFPNPDELDLGRSPNRHVAFGQGIHYCLGAPLARMEAAIALNVLARRFPGLRLGVGRPDIEWRKGLVLRGPRRLDLEFPVH